MPSLDTCHIYRVEGWSDKKMGALRVLDNLDQSRPFQKTVQCCRGISTQDRNRQAVSFYISATVIFQCKYQYNSLFDILKVAVFLL